MANISFLFRGPVVIILEMNRLQPRLCAIQKVASVSRTDAKAASLPTPATVYICRYYRCCCCFRWSCDDRCAGLSDVTTSTAAASGAKGAKGVPNIPSDTTPTAHQKSKASTAAAAISRLPLLLPLLLLSLAVANAGSIMSADKSSLRAFQENKASSN
jgi:hypothetical protein